ncbi:MAG TPA: redoxin domain-containing protein [Candidatus Acidoferrum sp.]|nr:redoxin domain-containing protein [Candidatus Acidoferrum sp.]
MKCVFVFLSLTMCIGAAALAAEDAAPRSFNINRQVLDFALLDTKGRFHELRRTDAKAVVLFFTMNECPIARQSYSKLRELQKGFADRGVDVWIISTDDTESRASIEKEMRDHGVGSTPVLIDDAKGVTRMLGVTRTCEAIAIGTKDWKVFYRGAVDDQLVEGAKKPAATAKYLERALEEFLSARAVTEATTVVHGCVIHFDSPKGEADTAISYAKDIAPLLEKKCVQCHSPGNIGQWSMSNYGKVKSKAAMMQEVVLARRMPPWDADPHYGKFSNDRSLTTVEKRLLLRWIEEGARRGDGEDPLASLNVPKNEWPLGKPDLIVSLPAPQEIPATGVFDYRHVDVPLELTNAVWVGAAVIKPGNYECTHHVIVRVKYPKEGRTSTEQAEGLEGWSPGKTFERFPTGTGIRLKPGAVINFELHYTATGKPETDRTEIGLYFLKEKPELRYESRMAVNLELNIPPGESDVRTHATAGFKRDTMLYGFVPHMHTRGAWMKYEALYPDGRRETLLHVPRYDFNWQIEYTLAQPKRMPAGSWILCTGGFDNSARNPNNPDPKKRVTWGEQSFDEMFIGFLNVAELPETKTLSKK